MNLSSHHGRLGNRQTWQSTDSAPNCHPSSHILLSASVPNCILLIFMSAQERYICHTDESLWGTGSLAAVEANTPDSSTNSLLRQTQSGDRQWVGRDSCSAVELPGLSAPGLIWTGSRFERQHPETHTSWRLLKRQWEFVLFLQEKWVSGLKLVSDVHLG